MANLSTKVVAARISSAVRRVYTESNFNPRSRKTLFGRKENGSELAPSLPMA